MLWVKKQRLNGLTIRSTLGGAVFVCLLRVTIATPKRGQSV